MDVILRRISDAPSLPLIWRHMTRYFRRHGFAANSYYLMRSGSSFPATVPLQHGFSREEVETYLSFDFQRLDIVPRQTIAAGVPVRWNEVWSTTQTTPEERHFWDAVRAVGFSDGFSLPCYGPANRNAVVSIGHMTGKTEPEPALLSMLHFAAQAAHLRICALFADDVARDRQLSSREKEILDWVARGKSNTVIAEILEISPGTVDTYMRRIYEKLDVSDRTSAAVKGVGMGLIAA
ncbi:MAG: autoinducer binding domain-containing protein [Sphingobium sp.]|nr:autoinducer binding domain-containing protein [Sphingobium sp.]